MLSKVKLAGKRYKHNRTRLVKKRNAQKIEAQNKARRSSQRKREQSYVQSLQREVLDEEKI